jgi:transposase
MYADRKRNRRDFDPALYTYRNERFFNRAKNLRRIATRYEKTARNFLAMICLGAVRRGRNLSPRPRHLRSQVETGAE